MFFSNSNYYKDIDGHSGPPLMADEPEKTDKWGNPIIPDEALNFTPEEIGTTTNPFGNQLESLKARIREGVGRIEFSFLGQGKGNSQQSTPESYGTKERQDIRELLEINKMKTSTHAAVHSDSLAGFTNRGFSAEARGKAMKEIKKAVDFAGEATKGGAIVFHLSEWMRPVSDIKDPKLKFQAYDGEEKDAVLFTVDGRTGAIVSTINKDKIIFRPKYETAKTKGWTHDSEGKPLDPDDWIDEDGKKISRSATNTERLLKRVPIYNAEANSFETDKLHWEDLEEEAKRWRTVDPSMTPEKLYALTEIENQYLSAKGNSLYFSRDYQDAKRSYEEIKDKYNLYKEMKQKLPEDEHYKLAGLVPEEVRKAGLTGEEGFKRVMDSVKSRLKYMEEAGSSYDVRARELAETAKHIKTAPEYGLDKTAETLAKSALYAKEVYEKNKDKYGLEDPLYVAPENWDPRQYGSHPEEYRKIIEASRNKMTQMLRDKGHSEEEAKSLAKKHIKGTLDIGHLNLFRSHHKAKEGQSPEEVEKDFQKWIIDEAEKLVKEGYVGHIHLADNFGYDDEHLTPGEGNIPMKEFMKKLEEAGMKDIIVEPGSFNPQTALPDTLAMTRSPIYGAGRSIRFNQIRNQHFGYNAPGFFIAGAYAPSNEWKFWTDTPLE